MKSSELEQKVKTLQEQLAVSNAEVSKFKSESERQKSVIVNLTKQVRESKESNKVIPTLEEELKVKESKIKSLEEENQKLQKSRNSNKILRESIVTKQGELKKLQESINSIKQEYDEKLNKVNEELILEKQNSSKNINELTEEVSKTRRMVEGYKKLANSTVDKYIDLKAVMLSVRPEEIKNKLPQSYKLSDVERVCESLQAMEINLGRLPFKVGKNTVVKVKESKQVINPKANIYDDDYVDEDLLHVAKIIK